MTFSGSEVFNYPWSAAYIVSTIFVTGPLSSAPETVKSLLGVVGFVAIIRLVAPLGPRAVLGACIAGVLFALENIRYTFAGTPPGSSRRSSSWSPLQASASWAG